MLAGKGCLFPGAPAASPSSDDLSGLPRKRLGCWQGEAADGNSEATWYYEALELLIMRGEFAELSRCLSCTPSVKSLGTVWGHGVWGLH